MSPSLSCESSHRVSVIGDCHLCFSLLPLPPFLPALASSLGLPGKSSTIGLSNFFTYLWGDTEATKEPLKDAALGRVRWVCNHLDHEYRPRPVDEIIAAAEKMASDRKKYGAPIQNSERFVNALRYGQIPRKWVRSPLGCPLSFGVFLGWDYRREKLLPYFHSISHVGTTH